MTGDSTSGEAYSLWVDPASTERVLDGLVRFGALTSRQTVGRVKGAPEKERQPRNQEGRITISER